MLELLLELLLNLVGGVVEAMVEIWLGDIQSPGTTGEAGTLGNRYFTVGWRGLVGFPVRCIMNCFCCSSS
jgi:hypothetical protein